MGREKEEKFIAILYLSNCTTFFYVLMLRNEGIAGLYRGTTATIARASLVTAGQMASYDHTKHVLKSNSIMNEGFNLHIMYAIFFLEGELNTIPLPPFFAFT